MELILYVVPVVKILPPELELYQFIVPNPVADSDNAPVPQRDAPVANGAEFELLIIANTETRKLAHPAALVASA
jgi:hypothetical protein